MKTSSLSFRVYVTPDEKYRIMISARDCRMSMSAFCRTLALGAMPTSKQDLAQVDNLLKAVADLNRLGNLMKMLLTDTERLEDMGREMGAATIDGVLVDIRFTVAKPVLPDEFAVADQDMNILRPKMSNPPALPK